MGRDVRAVPHALALAAVVLLTARIGAEVYEHAHPPEWADLVHWKTPAEAADLLSTGNRPALYDFSASWCEPCQQMRQEVFSDESGARVLDEYVAVRVDDDDHSTDAQAIRRRFITTSLPTLLVTGPALQAPLVMAGYPGRDKTLSFLKASFLEATKGVPGLKIEVEK